MADTLTDYLKEYGKLSLEQLPLNDVDSLALCQLAYLKFDGMVPGLLENRKSVTLTELLHHADYERLYADERYERDNRQLFEAMEGSVRFGKMRLNCYISLTEKEWETQFSAVTFLFENGIMYLAYRGTDETIVGWKEDFNMAYLSPVPGQILSVKYLNIVTGKLHNRFYVGGHSKGGNLAVYAAMHCIPSVRERIERIYSMDGPGFRPEVLEECDYEGIADKVVKILPKSSLVGMLFEQDTRYKTIESRTLGLLQHNPFTWVVRDGDFVRAEDIYEHRRVFDESINEWILSRDREQLKAFVDTLFQVISASQADDLIELAADWKKSLNGILGALRKVDEETAEMLREVVRSLAELMKSHMREELAHRRRLRAGKQSKQAGGLRRRRSAEGPAVPDAIEDRKREDTDA